MKSINAVVLASALALCACSNFQAQPPQGFAAFEGKSPFRAASPDGVLYRVRSEDNEPKAELAFWREAMKKRMTEAGYEVLKDGDVKAGEAPGYLLELAAPVGQADYAYLVALFVHGDDLVIVEAAGEVTKLTARRDAVLQAIGALRL